MIITLPFPHTDLSPNSRKHWSNRARKAKVARKQAMLTVLEQPFMDRAPFGKCTGKVEVSLQFIPNANRHYDLDGLISRMKSALDGIADGLAINDRRFTFGKIELLPAQKPGSVVVTISQTPVSV